MAGYFVAAVIVAFNHGHYLAMPFLCLFLCGFGYVGGASLWQGGIGRSLRSAVLGLYPRRTVVVPPPAFAPFAGPDAAANSRDAWDRQPTVELTPHKRPGRRVVV